jgi:hypothetical protein
MGRGRIGDDKPFRFIRNSSAATAANVYLLLYPKEPLARAMKDDPSVEPQVWEFLRGISAKDLLSEGRVYGGGLHKLEPKELANVNAKPLEELATKDEIQRQAVLF